jgi:hypothetical protein
MAEAAPDHSASKRIVDLDDLFQVLITRDIPAFVAKKQITEALQLGKLRIDLHIAAGARKTRPMRQATPEELKAEQAGQDLDFLYETSPAGGTTAAVDPQSWDVPGVLTLAIRDGHLVVEPQCSLDFPWQAYSFSISNLVVIDELWPLAASKPAPALPVAPGNPMERPPSGADMITHLEWAYLQLLTTNRAAGLRGKVLLKAACDEVAPKFTASPSLFKVAKRRAKARLAKARSA